MNRKQKRAVVFSLLAILTVCVPLSFSFEEEQTYQEKIEGLENIIKQSDALLAEDKEDTRALFDRGKAHYYLGVIYRELFLTTLSQEYIDLTRESFTTAVDDLSRAIKIDPDFYEAYVLRGLSYGLMDLSRAAIADFTYVIESDPGNAGAYFARGREYWELGEYEKAKEDYDKAVELDPQWKDQFYIQ
jgi:tetratricopeptide (TPR) repeat protein